MAEAPSEARQRSWLARSAGRVIHPAGESCLTAAEAEWEGSQLGSLFNWRAPEHECESDFDGVTGAVNKYFACCSDVELRFAQFPPSSSL